MPMPEEVRNLPAGRRRDLDRRTGIDWDDLAGQFADLAQSHFNVRPGTYGDSGSFATIPS